jgi:hypothetical protein
MLGNAVCVEEPVGELTMFGEVVWNWWFGETFHRIQLSIEFLEKRFTTRESGLGATFLIRGAETIRFCNHAGTRACARHCWKKKNDCFFLGEQE